MSQCRKPTLAQIEKVKKRCEKMAEAVAAMSDEEIGPLTPEEEEARQRVIKYTDELIEKLRTRSHSKDPPKNLRWTERAGEAGSRTKGK